MRPRFLLAAAALLGAFAGPGIAAAQSIAYAVPYGTTNMRAGPDLDFQVIAIIRGGSAVTVYGCLRDFSWCDSSVENIRGWVSSTRLQFQYGGNLVPIPSYYGYFDAPIIEFDFGYWDRYYSNEPFYRERHHRRHYRHNYNDDRVILPEGGGGERPRDQGRRQHFSDEGGGVIDAPPAEGRGRQRHHRPPSDQGDLGAAPDDGGGNSSPRHRGSDNTGRGRQGGGEQCPATNPNCR